MNQKEIDSNHISLHPTVKIILIQLLSYFRYTQILPMVLLQAGLPFLIVTGLLMLVGPENVYVPFVGNLEIKLDANDIINLYLLFALALDIIVSLINYFLKKKIVWTFWQKIRTILIADAIAYLFIFLYVVPSLNYLSSSCNDMLLYYLMLASLILTVFFTFWGMGISYGINLLINKIDNS